jgi:hypothetical protein
MLSRPAAALLLILASAALHPAASASARDRARTFVQTRILISGVLAIATGYTPQAHIIYLNGSAPDDFADGKNASDGSRHMSDLDQYYKRRSLCSCIFVNSLASIFSSFMILSLLCQEEGDTGYIGNGFFSFVEFVSQTTFIFSFGLAIIAVSSHGSWPEWRTTLRLIISWQFSFSFQSSLP